MEKNTQVDPETETIRELVKTLHKIREDGFKIQARLLLEAEKTNKLYEQILHQLSRQNAILDNLKVHEKVKVSY